MIVKIIAFENLRFQMFPSITSGVFKKLNCPVNLQRHLTEFESYNVTACTLLLYFPAEELNIDSCSQHNHSLYFVDFVILSSKLSSKQSNPDTIGYIRILGIGMELACNGGSCGELSLKRD